MRNLWYAAALWLTAVCVVASGAGTEARAQYSRRTPVVEAVQKTRASIVTIKVEKRGRSKETIGTGVIVDERGYVITNRHVVHEGLRVTVCLADGTDVRGRVLAADPRCDLAILRIKTSKDLRALLLAPVSDVMVGETVIAIGHPFGYRNTVSTGIISAVGREIEMPTGDVLTGMFQIDASINPGNSGGPLLNINGELIGINSALREGAQCIAFAINADTVKVMLSKHLSAQKVAGVKHGLACKENVLAEGKQRQRVVVSAVTKGTPAAHAGIRQGDEIVKIGSQSVTNRFDVERALWDSRPGEQVELKVLRDGKLMSVALTLSGKEKVQRVAKHSRRRK